MGRIEINKMQFQANHGAFEYEKYIRQIFVVSVSFSYDYEEAALNDDLNKTVNYADIVDLCREEMMDRKFLLESVALSIAHRIKKEFEGVSDLNVELEKPQVQMGVNLESVKVSYHID